MDGPPLDRKLLDRERLGMSDTERRRPQGAGAVRVLVVAVAALAAALTALGFNNGGASRSVAAPWVLIAGACVATELFLVHFEHRREAHSISFGAVPIVLGLYTLAPHELIGAVVAASVVARVLVLRQAPIKCAVNITTAWLGAAAAATAFHAFAGDASGVGTWPAAIGGAVVADVVQNVVVSAAISLYTRNFEFDSAATVLGVVSAVANAGVALIAVTLLDAEPLALLLLAALLPVLYVSYRVHARLREQHRDLEQLYTFSRQITSAVARGTVVATLIEHVQEFMRAEDAWICVPVSTDDGGKEAVVRVRVVDGVAVSSETAVGGVDVMLHELAQSQSRSQLVAADDGGDVARALAASGVAQALIAPLGHVGASPGTIVVADRSGEVRQFGEQDVRLFATLVSHASASLENSHLLDRLREQAAESEHAAMHDALTGLPNRTLFGRRVDAALPTASPLAVLLLDLDRFKEVNDTLGHHNGDVLLEEVGRRLSTVLRHGDTVARLGGDEFAVLLPGIASAEAAVQVARGLLAVLERPATLFGVTITVSGSIGIAIAPDHGADAAVLLQRADVAMYSAKASQSGVELYDEARDVYSPDRLALATELRRAIEREELQVHYQPQVDLATGAVVGVEALIRWIDDSGWRMSPADLVGLAEQTGLIGALTRSVLRRAVAQASQWHAAGYPIRVSVNLSARTLAEETLAEEVRQALAEFGLPASALCLELTETTIMGDEERTMAVLEQLRAVGTTIAVDDFGVGYSSLAYLAKLPVGEIKIDKSFVFDMPASPSNEMIVRSVVDLAANLGIPVVAEGVETDEVRDALVLLGCKSGQGYLFSRPLPAREMTAWLAERAPAPGVRSEELVHLVK